MANLAIRIVSTPPETTFTVTFVMPNNEVAITGFPSFDAASVWVMEWLTRAQKLAAADETQRQMIGAVLLRGDEKKEKM